jgi:uroporphyrinogen-III synthase
LRIWVTRTEPQAGETARRLEEMGHEPAVAPVLMAHALPITVELVDIAALAFTSRNAVAAFARECPRRDLPVFAVGDSTAADARELGFHAVISAGGDVDDLAALIAQRKPAGTVLHPAAAEPAGDLAGALRADGIAVRTLTIYETVETGLAAPPDIEAVLIHSPRAGRIVARMLSNDEAAPLSAYCISEAAAQPLSAVNFHCVAVAPYPNEQALLKLLPR